MLKYTAEDFRTGIAFFKASRNAKKITVRFFNGQTADYTTDILTELKNDRSVMDIIDATTGEVLYIAE